MKFFNLILRNLLVLLRKKLHLFQCEIKRVITYIPLIHCKVASAETLE